MLPDDVMLVAVTAVPETAPVEVREATLAAPDAVSVVVVRPPEAVVVPVTVRLPPTEALVVMLALLPMSWPRDLTRVSA